MADIRLTCETCSGPFKDVFDPSTGTRDFELIAGDLETEKQCFVRDEIKFVNKGRLIFKPWFDEERKKWVYHEEYFVICRKLTVIGGRKPTQILPCEPDAPGSMYNANNVIIWKDRLKNAANGGPPNPAKNDDGQSYGGYSDTGIGNDGKKGDDGKPGDPNKANPGVDGKKAPKFTIICTEVEMGLGDHLTIDFNGQNGGQGGRGQKGGNGGKGMNGRGGESDTTWPGKGCDRQPGNGGDGGNGGEGGPGASGGSGGDAGDISIFSTTDNITTGPLGNGSISYINGGGFGGRGGNQGLGGQKGLPGQPGFKTSECSTALAGSHGFPGLPTTPADAMANPGPTGNNGNPGNLDIKELTTGECADAIPLEPIIGPLGLQPASYCRGFATPATVHGSISGQFLSQISSVTVSLTGVTATKKLTSTDTQLDLKFDILGNSATGAGDLTLKRYFGADVTLNNAITVQHFDVTAIAPASGAKNTSVNVTITGQCFDPGALAQHVMVSGPGITVYNVVIVDSTTITCTFDIGGPLAVVGARDVTVVIGPNNRTLLNSFTVTA